MTVTHNTQDLLSPLTRLLSPTMLNEQQTQSTNNNNNSHQSLPWLYIPKRIIVALLTSFGLLLLSVVQTNFAITASFILNPKDSKDIPVDADTLSYTTSKIQWTSVEMGYLNSIFYLGYIATHIPSGYLVTKLSPTRLFVYPLLIMLILNFFLPFSISILSNQYHINYYSTAIIRLLQGFCAGCAFPASHGIVANWCPPNERGRMGGFIYTGLYAGPVLGFALGGLIAKYFGHYIIYYATGMLGLIWSLTFILLIYDSPREHPTISKAEKDHIEKSIAEVASLYEPKPVPWRAILTSLPVWAIAFAHFARGWTFYLLLTNQPAFLNAFGFSVAENGTLGSLPHIMKVLVALQSGFLADYMRLKLWWSTKTVRKIMTCTGYIVEAMCLMVVCHVHNGYIGIALLTIGVGASGLMVSGWHLNHQDLAPRYASVLAGFTAFIGTTAGIISPIIAGILTRKQDILGWTYVFTICSLVLFGAAIFYFFFAAGDLQIWATHVETQTVRLHSEKLPSVTAFEHSIQEDVPIKKQKNNSQSFMTSSYNTFNDDQNSNNIITKN
ncbi:unnamed protein product [Didymodactylos carnosus]|uniref:Major facilitator superfamily (MFS) profile domain-containing protein n=1 Tax=Didymodactylos carnosus TaxID=1234261 RepID=A0A814BZS9_9BILA|nr:unnamed protein product [Didymodactylos carnosus]CAF0933337.1 unnamed protein product [Didymodactylos carnosus]CAF3590879.1 unnamed protein product [Didymodactylos carnosus]CAF3710966.1 unnamed protein product [Didymodactylos carnosus]